MHVVTLSLMLNQFTCLHWLPERHPQFYACVIKYMPRIFRSKYSNSMSCVHGCRISIIHCKRPKRFIFWILLGSAMNGVMHVLMPTSPHTLLALSLVFKWRMFIWHSFPSWVCFNALLSTPNLASSYGILSGPKWTFAYRESLLILCLFPCIMRSPFGMVPHALWLNCKWGWF